MGVALAASSAIQSVPSVLQRLLILFAPESPRWLVSKGCEEEALETLAYYHADGDIRSYSTSSRNQKLFVELDRTVAANLGWKSLVATPGNRKCMRVIVAFAFFSQWSCNGLVSYYYLNKVFDQIGGTGTQLLINDIQKMWNLGRAMYGAFMVNQIGRRFLSYRFDDRAFLHCTSDLLLQYEYAQHGKAAAGRAVTAFIFLEFTPLIVS